MSRWDSGVAEASGRSSPPGRPPAVGVTAPLRSPRSSGPQPPSPDFQLLMLQPIKYWSIELRKRLKPGFSSVS